MRIPHRFDQKITPENDLSGAPLLFVNGRTTHAVEAVVGEKSGDFSFVKPREGSLCDKTQAFKLRDGVIAILYSKDDRPFQDVYQVVAYDFKRDQVLDKKELGAVSHLSDFKNGFAFTTVVPRTDVHTMEMTSTFGRKIEAHDSDLAAIQTLKLPKDRLVVAFDPDLSFARSEYKKYFKNKKEYLAAAGWDESKKTFANPVVYKASYFNRKESDIQVSCIGMTTERQAGVRDGAWRCLKERQ